MIRLRLRLLIYYKNIDKIVIKPGFTISISCQIVESPLFRAQAPDGMRLGKQLQLAQVVGLYALQRVCTLLLLEALDLLVHCRLNAVTAEDDVRFVKAHLGVVQFGEQNVGFN